MNSILATTGTAALLEQLSPFVPDEFISDYYRSKRRPGPHPLYGPAQLYRVHLLALLTSVHSFNLLVKLLKENRSWRRFAHLSHRQQVPDAKMLHQFRDGMGVAGLRAINAHLLAELLDGCAPERKTVAIIDSTDLPAATNAYKKNRLAATRPPEPLWVDAHANMGTAAGLSATKSTRCDYGFRLIIRAFYWSRWFHGWHLAIVAMRCFCVRA
jgi:hypothetical protein